MNQTTHRFRTALATRDLDAIVQLLADNVVFRSPVVYNPYHGRNALSAILAAVFRVFDEWHCVRQISPHDSSDHALVFHARIGDRQIEGCDFLHLDHNGQVDEFYVMVRPLSGALALADATTRQLARTESLPQT